MFGAISMVPAFALGKGMRTTGARLAELLAAGESETVAVLAEPFNGFAPDAARGRIGVYDAALPLEGEQLVVTARTIVPQMVVVADQQGVDMQLSDQIFQNEFLIGHAAEFEGEGHDDRVIYPEACKDLELFGKRGKQRDRSVANYGSRMRVERDDGTFTVSLAGQFVQSVEYGPVSVVDAVV